MSYEAYVSVAKIEIPVRELKVMSIRRYSTTEHSIVAKIEIPVRELKVSLQALAKNCAMGVAKIEIPVRELKE